MLKWGSLPALSPLLRDRKLALAITASATLLMVLFAAGIPGWPCPFLHALGIPCPGCGLTRATYALLHGDLRGSVHFHAFAPVFLLGLGIVSAAGVLPETARQSLIDKFSVLEQRTGFVLILLAALILYWLARLVFLNSAFVQLIRG